MKKLYFFIIVILFIGSAPSYYEREITVGISGYKSVRPFVQASVYQPDEGFKWIDANWRPSLGVVGVFRHYNDGGYGLYSSGALWSSLGRLEFIGGLFGYDLAAAAHLSRIEDGYEYTEFLAGVRITADYTFWLERTYAEADIFLLIGQDFLVGWGGANFYPIPDLAVGFGLHYDGELDHWGNAPFLDDRWEYGMNCYMSLQYQFKLR